MTFKNAAGLAAWFVPVLIMVVGPFAAKAGAAEATLLASDILDRDVYDGKQALIGEVDDMVIRRNGRVKKLTVEFGGLMDIGDKLVALPFKGFEVVNGNVHLDATEEQLRNKPEFDYLERGLRIEHYFYMPRWSQGPQGAEERPEGPFQQYPPRYHHYRNPPLQPMQVAFSPSRFLASSIMGRRLVNERGREIGRVGDLAIDRSGGTVDRIILFSRDILGKVIHVALPYKPLDFTSYGIVYEIEQGDVKEYLYPVEK